MRHKQIISAAFLLTGVAAMSFAGPPKPAGGSVSGKVTYCTRFSSPAWMALRCHRLATWSNPKKHGTSFTT